MSNLCYKVCIEYASCSRYWLHANRFAVTYELNKKTEAKLGQLFVFKYLSHAIEWQNAMFLMKETKQILLCESSDLTFIEDVVYCKRDSDYLDYWIDGYASQKMIPAPFGTHLTKWVIPIKDVYPEIPSQLLE